MRELDVLLARYAACALPAASPGERRTLARFLALPDPELAAYLLGGTVPSDAELAVLAQRVLEGGAARPVADRAVHAA